MKKIRTVRAGRAAALSLLSLVVLVLAQLGAQLLGSAPVALGAPVWLGNLLAGGFYVALAWAGLRLLCNTALGCTLESCRITRFMLQPLWCAAAVLLPLLVSGALLCMPGNWAAQPLNGPEKAALVAGAVAFFGAGAGAVEEMVFRGVLMASLERRWGKAAAIWVPSVAFALLHLLGAQLNAASIALLLVSGTAVGVMFSLVAYASGTVWCGALIHALWNILMVGGILDIGSTASEGALYSYVLESDSLLLTGGGFGVEASLPAVAGYLAVAALAFALARKKGRL